MQNRIHQKKLKSDFSFFYILLQLRSAGFEEIFFVRFAQIEITGLAPPSQDLGESQNFIVDPEGINQNIIYLSDLIVNTASVGDWGFCFNQRDKFRLLGDILRQAGIGCANTVRLVGIAAAETGLVVNIRQLSGLNIPLRILARIKGLNKVKFFYNVPVFTKNTGYW